MASRKPKGRPAPDGPSKDFARTPRPKDNPSDARWKRVPRPVREAWKGGWAVVPQSSEKKVIVRWAEYQRHRPSRKQIEEWANRWPDARWAVVTGRRSVVVLDFDGASGMATMKRLGLRPVLTTPHGGAHVWIADVPWRVSGGARVDEENVPGLDIRADGQVATLYGDGYEQLAEEPYTFDQLPKAVRDLLRSRRKRRRSVAEAALPDGWTGEPAQLLLGEALARLRFHPRNETGFWLACQLRDERYSRREIGKVMRRYADLVSALGNHPYTRQEAYDSMMSALSEVPRAPRAARESAVIELISEVKAEKLRWLWQDRIPMRKVTVMEGDPDLGKSTITLDVAARTTRGRGMPDGSQKPGAGAVLIICAEDDIADTVKPRLRAARAKEDRIATLPLARDKDGRVVPLSIPEDLARIEAAIRNLGEKTGVPVKLVIIDPITAYLSETIHYGNDPQVRKAMLPLRQLAEEMDVAVLLIRHLNKDASARALYRGGGSIAFTAAARSVLVAARHPEEPGAYVLARVKGNLSEAVRPLSYRITTEPRTDAPRIEWGDHVNIDVDSLLAAPDARKEAPARREAKRVLARLLADGPKPYKAIEEAAKAAGISMKTMRAARFELGVRAEPDRVKGAVKRWKWYLPAYVRGGEIHFDFD